MGTGKFSKSRGKLLVEFHRAAEEIVERFKDADIPMALEAAQKLKQAAERIPKKYRERALAKYFRKIRDILIGGTIYASSKDDSPILIRMGGPVDAKGIPSTEDKCPQGEFFMFDAIGSLIESANEIFSRRREKDKHLLNPIFLYVN